MRIVPRMTKNKINQPRFHTKRTDASSDDVTLEEDHPVVVVVLVVVVAVVVAVES